MFDEIDLSGFNEDRTPPPSGSDLEYDSVFTAMEQATQGKAEQQYGDTIIEAEPPEWVKVEEYATEILQQSHDLRACVYLASAVLANHGLAAFSQVISLLRDYVTERWETVHPVLDPDDDNDPTFRVNTLMTLCGMSSVLPLLKNAALVRVRAIGQFSLTDWLVANNELPWPEDSEDEKPDKALILSAFQACELDELEQIKNTLETLLLDTQEIEDFVTGKVGSSESCNFEELRKTLNSASKLVTEQFQNRAPVEIAIEEELAESAEDGEGETSTPGVSVPSHAITISDLKIKSRNEAIQVLDKVCDYFEQYEPSSPLPLLLRRARRLSMKSFLEIIQDISPDGMHQVTSLGGLDNAENDSSSTTSGVSPPSFDAADDDTY
ncbi:type VI secretion system protein TssA [bacterium]|nr:type VI secretion system protein TssA [Mariniblastus sp.]MDB4392068.1 type VI secretion system protein TssA [bacterium]